jgi:selenium-binding protein 1
MKKRHLLRWASLLLSVLCNLSNLCADETCSQPNLARIEGHQELVHVWTLEDDKLVTVHVRPGSPTYGKVVHTQSVGSGKEAHHDADVRTSIIEATQPRS